MAIELIDKIKQKNNGAFKLVDAVDVEMKDGSDLQESVTSINEKVSDLDVGLATTSSVVSEHIANHPGGDDIFIGDDEPIGSDYKIWIDMSDSDSVTESITDKVLDEIKSIIQSLKNEIGELRNKVIEHEARIEYLELHGGSGGVTPPPSETNTTLIFEDGSTMIFEDGSTMVFEDGVVETLSNVMIFEDSSTMIFEDGSTMIFEDGSANTLSNVMVFEDSSTMIFEDKNIMIFE